MFIPGLGIWSSQDVKDNTKVVYHPSENTHWTYKQTFEEKSDMLHIDVSGSVQVTLEVASIEADGSFEYLTE